MVSRGEIQRDVRRRSLARRVSGRTSAVQSKAYEFQSRIRCAGWNPTYAIPARGVVRIVLRGQRRPRHRALPFPLQMSPPAAS